MTTYAFGKNSPRKVAWTKNPDAASSEIVSVLDYGAKGDGTTDDTVAIQATLDAVSALPGAGGPQGVITFPNGTYKVTSELELPPNIHIVGSGLNFGSQLKPVHSDNNILSIDGDAVTGGFNFRVTIEDMHIDCSGWTPSGTLQNRAALLISDAYTIYVRNTHFFTLPEDTTGILLLNGSNAINDVTIDRCRIYGGDVVSADRPYAGVRITGLSRGIRIINTAIESFDVGVIAESTTVGTEVTEIVSLQVTNCYFERFADAVIWDCSHASGQLLVSGCNMQIVNNATDGVRIMQDNVTVIACDGPVIANAYLVQVDSSVVADLSNVHLIGMIPGQIDDASGYIPVTGGSGSAGAGNQYVEMQIGGTVYKVLHDGTV